MRFSLFGEKFTAKSGILGLMEDLGQASSGGCAVADGGCHLGGGNPARIAAVEDLWVGRLREIASDREACGALVGRYDGPQGRARFLEALAGLFRREYGWRVGPENIALTNGSQSAFFMLFNLLAGRDARGVDRKILFPLVPEYIGYADQSRFSADFSVCLPRVEETGPRRFKYRVDFGAIESRLDDSVAAICASRPTNPSGNVLTDGEVERLADLSGERDIPLILDGAYGLPFPSIIFNDSKPRWDDRIVLGLSLSKIGLPAFRTGIVVAKPGIIEALAAMNTIMSLASGSVGPEIMLPFVESGEVLRVSRDMVRPWYRERSLLVQDLLAESLDPVGIDWSLHESEGAIFHWLRLRDLGFSTLELYERLKRRGVFVIPGRYFFFGEASGWAHRDECLRVNYSGNLDEVRRGIEAIAEEVGKGRKVGAQ